MKKTRLVIYKSFGKYKVTKFDNYLNNVMDERKVNLLNMLYELFSPNLSSEDKIYVSTYIYGVFRLSDYIITNKGWKINID